jgi:hypothetical protein
VQRERKRRKGKKKVSERRVRESERGWGRGKGTLGND